MVVVFDTYSWIEYFEGSKQGMVVKDHLENYDIITPSITLLELSYKADKEGWDFEKHLEFIKTNSKIIGFNDEFVLNFGRIYNKVKKKIREIGLADIIILTTAQMNNAKILTGDPHFKSFSETIFLG